MPDLSFEKTTYPDPVAEFIKQATTTAGAKFIEVPTANGQQPKANLQDYIRQAYPDAKVIASNVPGIEADLNPDTVERAQDLDGTDVGVIEGTVACAENACVWVPMNMKQKAVCFISESLIIIVRRENIVSNMHEAYQWLKEKDATPEGISKYGFGTFISGPSKTADIEQSLVYGAQAAKSVTILLI
jgi:L-lactate dehydrogenase complex protein LldG